MSMCLNPGQRHSVQVYDSTRHLCPEPSCGFLLEGTWLQQWRVVSLLKHTSSMDLYAATPATEQERSQTAMAVRVLHAANFERFAALELLLTLSHPHIQPILALEEIEPRGPLYLMAPFETRGTLARVLETRVPLSFAVLARIVHQIADALHLAHEHNLVHGHLKPENCLIAASGVVQVGDFYLALVGGVPGNSPTPFTAPEQLQGWTQPASDQFALAVLVYLLFRQCSPLALGKARVATRMPAGYLLPSLEPLVAPTHPLDQVIRRALSQEPAERFPDFRTFLRFFDAALERLAGADLQSVAGSDRNTSPISLSGIPGRSASFAPGMPENGQRQASPSSPLALPPGAHVMRSNSSGNLQRPAEVSQRSFPARAYQNVQRNATHELPPKSVISTCLLPGHTATISALCWERNGRALVSGSEDGEIRLWTVQKAIGRLESVLQGHKGSVRMLCWSPDSTAVASASQDSALRIWDVSTPAKGARQAEISWWGHDGDVTALDWSPDGTILASGGKDGILRFWNRKGEGLLKLQAHSGKGVKSVAWSPDQSLIATGGNDQQIQIWDVVTSQRKIGWKAHQDEVRQLQWSPNRQFLASTGGKKDTRLCLWDAYTGQCLATVENHQREIVGLFWSHDSSWLATCSVDGLSFWLTNHVLEKRVAVPAGPVLTLNTMPQIMCGSSSGRMVAIATQTLSIEVFEMMSK